MAPPPRADPAVHESAASGYAVAAEGYAGGRPDYPDAADAWLRAVVGLAPGRRVLDLGAGTGKFLPHLLATGATVLASEPVAAMRAELERRFPGLAANAGTAQAIPLPDGTLDAVVCAQSFHWFARAEALGEIRRVLAPGGVLGLIWNVRDEGVGWVAALSRITDPFEAGTPRFRSGDWMRAFPADGFEAIGERRVRHAHVGPVEAVVVGRTLSVSFVAALPEAKRRAVADRVRHLVRTHPDLAGRAEIAFPYETVMLAFRRRCPAQ